MEPINKQNRFIRFVDGFLQIFRAPKDIHRVVAALFLSVTFSHIYLLAYEVPKDFRTELSQYELMLISLIGGLMMFQVFWTFLSSELNVKLYLRQFVVIGWSVLAHRLSFGVEVLGSVFVTIMLLTGWSIWIPFALTGMRFDELLNKIEVWQDAKKSKYLLNSNGPYIHSESNSDSSTIRPN